MIISSEEKQLRSVLRRVAQLRNQLEAEASHAERMLLDSQRFVKLLEDLKQAGIRTKDITRQLIIDGRAVIGIDILPTFGFTDEQVRSMVWASPVDRSSRYLVLTLDLGLDLVDSEDFVEINTEILCDTHDMELSESRLNSLNRVMVHYTRALGELLGTPIICSVTHKQWVGSTPTDST